jgi:hypothetical protein
MFAQLIGYLLPTRSAELQLAVVAAVNSEDVARQWQRRLKD